MIFLFGLPRLEFTRQTHKGIPRKENTTCKRHLPHSEALEIAARVKDLMFLLKMKELLKDRDFAFYLFCVSYST